MPLPVYYVGTLAEAEHHARPLRGEFDVRVEDHQNVLRHAKPGDVCIFYNEFFPRYRLANHELVRRQCATLFAIDGILEWRSLWEFPPGFSCLWSTRPILSHKVACVGRSQARILESWGNSRQCELVGVPRFDALLGRAARVRPAGEPFTILVLTAKVPGFNQVQRDRAAQSLKDLKAWLEAHPTIGDTPIKSLWRITEGLHEQVGVDNSLKDTTGVDLAQALTRVDAVVSTPSTAMLEGMLSQVPVALLDYNNCPHYVPAAWRITAPTHFDQAIPELVNPPPEKMLYQQHLLHDGLECHSPALPRFCELIYRMDAFARRAVAEGISLIFPRRLLRSPDEPEAALANPVDYKLLFPGNPTFKEYDIRRLQAEVADLRETLITLGGLPPEPVSMRAHLRRFRGKAKREVRRLLAQVGVASKDRRAA
jgi:hypothetical protein